MYEDHNKAALDALGESGALPYVHARNTLAIGPTPQMESGFDASAHRGLIRKYNTKANPRLLVVDHGNADRLQFTDCIRNIEGYQNFKIQFTD
jgi:hypothetical protein